jgi:hypothetical protein
MVSAFFYSVLVVPILLGLELGRRRRRRGSLGVMLVLLLAYDILYMLFLYYISGQWV